MRDDYRADIVHTLYWRPVDPYVGMIVYELGTEEFIKYTADGWVVLRKSA